MDKETRILAVAVYLVISLGGWARGGNVPAVFVERIPEADRKILSDVADEYGLTGRSRWLLFTIRLAEDGPDGLEMGVMTPAAQRYRGDHAKSLRLQAQYAAGTIKRRYTGDLKAFAERWAPQNAENDRKHGLNKYWLPNVQSILAQAEKNLH